MSLIIGKSEIEKALNIDLAAKIGVLKDAQNANMIIDDWINDRENEICDFIVSFALEGRQRIDDALGDNEALEAIKAAIIKQCGYTLYNRMQGNLGGIMLQGNSVVKLSKQERLDAVISPLAERILDNAGLLYRGSLC